MLSLALDEIFLVLNRRRVVPLYREVDAQRLSEFRPAHNSVRLGLLSILALYYKFTLTAANATGLKPSPGLGPVTDPPSSSLVLGFA